MPNVSFFLLGIDTKRGALSLPGIQVAAATRSDGVSLHLLIFPVPLSTRRESEAEPPLQPLQGCQQD